MKKILTSVLIAVIVAGFIACSSDDTLVQPESSQLVQIEQTKKAANQTLKVGEIPQQILTPPIPPLPPRPNNPGPSSPRVPKPVLVQTHP